MPPRSGDRSAATGYSNSCPFPAPSVPHQCPMTLPFVRAAAGHATVERMQGKVGALPARLARCAGLLHDIRPIDFSPRGALQQESLRAFSFLSEFRVVGWRGIAAGVALRIVGFVMGLIWSLLMIFVSMVVGIGVPGDLDGAGSQSSAGRDVQAAAGGELCGTAWRGRLSPGYGG